MIKIATSLRIRLLLATFLSWSAGSLGAQDDPFGGDDDPFSMPEERLMVRVQVEFIGLPHETLTKLMRGALANSDVALHARLRELTKKKEAKILETSIITLADGTRGVVESIMEYIYPTEYDPGGLGSAALLGELGDGVFPIPLRPAIWTAFETRNTGVTLEVDANVRPDREVIELRLAPEIVDLLRLKEWQEFKDEWGDASVRFPIFESLRTRNAMSLAPGKFSMVGFLSPRKDEGGSDSDQKILLFVKADLITIGGEK